MKTVKTILLVEDSEPLRNVLKEKLTDEGFTVLEAGGGEEGLKVATEQKPDLVITDLVMFPVDGRTMIEKIRQDTAWGKEAAVAALTNQNDIEEEERLKPFDLIAYWVKADSSLDDIVAKIKDLAKDFSKKK